MGRPSFLTPERHQIICRAIREGNTRACAAGLAGVSTTCIRTWAQKGREGDENYAAFEADLKKADAISESRRVKLIRKASITTWQAAAWWLERRRWKTWSRKVPELDNVAAAIEKLTDEQLRVRLREAVTRAEREINASQPRESSQQEPQPNN